MGAVIDMVPESAFHLSREAGICRGQPGRAGERLNRIECADGALIGMRMRRERVGRYLLSRRCGRADGRSGIESAHPAVRDAMEALEAVMNDGLNFTTEQTAEHVIISIKQVVS
jgi:hypothetical protein